MLLASEALVIVSFALEELLEVGFAVKLALESRKAAEAAERGGGGGATRLRAKAKTRGRGRSINMASPEFGVAVLAAEAGRMEDLVVGDQSLHRVDRLLTRRTHLLLGLEAEGLNPDKKKRFMTRDRNKETDANKTRLKSQKQSE